jgi:hypothetical protein
MPPGYGRPTHWDFMLESGGVLRTWALAEPPVVGRVIEAEQLPDHRLAYLDYEGEVSGGRGSVTRWDYGTCETVNVLQGEKEAPVLRLAMFGQKLAGEVVLTAARTPVPSPDDPGADVPRSPEGLATAASAPRYWSFIWKGT